LNNDNRDGLRLRDQVHGEAEGQKI
jgi:hypothetical protein